MLSPNRFFINIVVLSFYFVCKQHLANRKQDVMGRKKVHCIAFTIELLEICGEYPNIPKNN